MFPTRCYQIVVAEPEGSMPLKIATENIPFQFQIEPSQTIIPIFCFFKILTCICYCYYVYLWTDARSPHANSLEWFSSGTVLFLIVTALQYWLPPNCIHELFLSPFWILEVYIRISQVGGSGAGTFQLHTLPTAIRSNGGRNMLHLYNVHCKLRAFGNVH